MLDEPEDELESEDADELSGSSSDGLAKRISEMIDSSGPAEDA